jgi:hypothetical protein
MTPSSLITLVDRTTKEVKSPKVRGVAKEITLDPALNEGVMAMMERSSEMRSPLTALLAGIAADPKARRMWEESLDDLWSDGSFKTTTYPEVFIGSGLSGAIYCATRAAMGQPVPLVIEQDERVGGTFAVSRTPSFYLNSRNRPGGLGIPGSQGSLNFLPNAPIQPSEIGFEEYQVNSDLAFAIRAVYALTGAEVVTKSRVFGYNVKYDSRKRGYYVEVGTPRGVVKANRVIIGTGIGEPRGYWYAGPRLVSFKEFMRSLDQPFPFRNMGRVAVIGAGDSGKVVIEALTGQGPARHMSVAALDFPRDIVWYGQQSLTREDFEACNRPRYRRIGTLFSNSGFRNQRVTPRTNRVEYVEEGYDCVLVDGQPFDLAIDCTGINQSEYVGNMYVPNSEFWMSESENDYNARQFYSPDAGDYMIFLVGPAAQLPKTRMEQRALPDPVDPQRLRESLVAAYRYAGRTAMFAQQIS